MAEDAESETYSKELVERLKADLAAKSEEAAKLRAFKNGHDEKQRAIIAQLQPDISSYVGELIQNNQDYAGEMASIAEWSKNCHESNSLETAMPLARVLSCASAAFKRTREEASANAERAGTLSATMKELEEIKSDRDNKAQRVTELESLAAERQTALESMQEKLVQAGLVKDRMDFSLQSSREVNAEKKEPAAVESALATNNLQMVTSCASRKTASPEDELMSFIGGASKMGGSSRITQSATGHAHLGAQGGGVEAELAAAVRGF